MMELRPVGVGGVLAVLGNAIRSETGAQVAAVSYTHLRQNICKTSTDIITTSIT